jgi:hypothetical protein
MSRSTRNNAEHSVYCAFGDPWLALEKRGRVRVTRRLNLARRPSVEARMSNSNNLPVAAHRSNRKIARLPRKLR